MLRPVPAPQWTPEQAREMAVRGNQAKAAARLARAERLNKAANGTEFQEDTLARTREILTSTMDRMAKATDPKDLELLARAASHMAELERRLAGRPLPGTTRRDGPAAPPPRAKLPDPR